jgi:hypothetical protein
MQIIVAPPQNFVRDRTPVRSKVRERYYADAAAFAKKLEQDVEDKRLLLQRLGLPK